MYKPVTDALCVARDRFTGKSNIGRLEQSKHSVSRAAGQRTNRPDTCSDMYVFWITSIISHSADAITRLSFYKEELAGERSNYVHLRASAEELPPMEVLRQLVDEVLDTARRIEKITGTDRELHVLWNEYLQVRIPHARYDVRSAE